MAEIGRTRSRWGALTAWGGFVLALGLASACELSTAPRYIPPPDTTEQDSQTQGVAAFTSEGADLGILTAHR